MRYKGDYFDTKLTITRKDSQERNNTADGDVFLFDLNTILLSYLFTVTCKGICLRHKAQKPVGSGRYVTGQKRCQVCELFMKWEALWCPCCGYRLRTRPRNSLFKKRLLVKGQLKRAEAVVVRY